MAQTAEERRTAKAASNTRYYAAHPGRRAEEGARYRAANPGREADSQARWYAANRDEVRVKAARGRAVAVDAPVNDFDLLDWRELLNQYDNLCAYCGTDDAPLGVEHKTPLSRGGENSKANIVPACSDCNLRKGTKTVPEFLAAKAAA